MTSTRSVLDQADAFLRKHSKNVLQPLELSAQDKLRTYQAFFALEHLNPAFEYGINALKLINENKRFLIEKFGQKVFDATLLKAKQAWTDKEAIE